MQAIGVRELREHLSRVLADVQDGETIVVTKAGAPIARIEPLRPGVPDEVQRLLASADVTWGGRPLEPHEPVAIGPGPDVADILVTMRGRDDAVSGQ
jgi:prevent-host-death family protein